MYKILLYELKRLIFNKLFLALLIITSIYAYIILSGEIILGIAYTAPFSPWSFSAYLSKVLPLLMITLLFFITFMYSRHEKQVRQLTYSTPFDLFKLCLIKCASVAAAFLLITFLIVILCMTFYAILFKFYDFGSFILPIILILIPCFLFILGMGLFLGSINYNFLFIMMIAVLLLGFIPLPVFLDLYGSGFFSTYPLSLPLGLDGEPAFSLPTDFIMGRGFFCIIGIMMVLITAKFRRNIQY